jgi:hypothetical protein
MSTRGSAGGYMHGNLALLADIAKKPPSRGAAGVKREAVAAGHSNVHAISAKCSM